MKKSLAIPIFILLALPVPLSLLAWFGMLMSVEYIGTTPFDFATFIALITTLIAGTYLITYIVSLVLAIEKKSMRYSWFCVGHIGLLMIFLIILFFISMALKNSMY